jgi:hypothetical protein
VSDAAPSGALIDRFLPRYDLASRHRILVRAPLEHVYAAARQVDLTGSTATRWLFRLRGLPVPESLRLEGLLRLGFVLLDEDPGHELVLGVVGRFWVITGGLQRVEPEEFTRFDQPGYAKAAWNFRVEEGRDRSSLLSTETRVLALDGHSRRRFGWYWIVVGPFSGLIRREALRLAKRRAEERAAVPR